ncbi:LacI family DNA-binding transcriptional regulator [Lacrimispora sp.]|jgi:LacI family sucrose operon transcriptional repressor|uniref:LacI family DNA-binding transcriptional regulator n=1 Tax=Lacrimispora sp. TaxID=2719234 RepID=UPI0028AD5974|nr:LacI family DNA-binding transcriptional regulator [Lacrimispora sp.]
MASIRDVALKAGVGIGTVSRALNGTGYIAEETKKKILDAVKELEYVPNELAQNLYRKRSGFVGVMVPDLEHPFFSGLTKYIENELYKHGYKCMTCGVDKKFLKQEEYLEMLQRNVMDGLISCVDLAVDTDISNIRRPIVCMDRSWGPNVANIHSDHRRGGLMAAEALLKGGCQKVVQFMPMPFDNWGFLERHKVFRERMEGEGRSVLEVYTPTDRMVFEYSDWVKQECARFIDYADGIFADDIAAITCLKVAREHQIDVPGKLKIVGYDGIPLTRIIHPTITTVCQNLPEIAKRCVNTIMQEIEGAKLIELEQIVDVSFQEGGTV